MAVPVNQNGVPLTPAQKARMISRYNAAFGTNITNMGQLDAALMTPRDQEAMTPNQRRTINSLGNSYGGSQ